jgi:hypothetical protein
MIKKNWFKGFIACVAIACFIAMSVPVFAAPPTMNPPFVSLGPGDTWVVTETTNLRVLTIAEGANIIAPPGKSVTMTVNGVETGQAMADISGATPDFSITSGRDTAFLPGTYFGNIVLTVTEANPVVYNPQYTFPFRQALYLDATGIVEAKSVLAAVIGKKPAAFDIKNILISSTGECFDGIFAAGGNWTITNAKINLTGNGRSDFCGYGAAVVCRGTGTTLVLDNAWIVTHGVVRTAAIADKGSNLIVKNSYLQTYDGVLPGDYFSTIDTSQMRDAPWMLGCWGTTRATNLLGVETKASYINSYIGAEGWGVLSTDGCTRPILTAINSTIATTGETGGYGSYVIGSATEYFYGCTFNVGTYANILKGGTVYYNDSTRALVEGLNNQLKLGLTEKELDAIPVQPTVVNSENWGSKWHGAGTVNVAGGTVFNTANACFLVKNQNAVINVDGSEGAQFNPADSIIFELIDMDDVGPGTHGNNNVYYERATPPTRTTTLAQRIATTGCPVATFSNIDLEGNFYNSVGWTTHQRPGSPPASDRKNVVFNFNNATVTGVISATQAHHEYEGVAYPVIDSNTYYALGHLVNTPWPVINSGVIVFLNSDSNWTVTGTSYLSKLAIAADATITAPEGYSVVMTVDGVPTNIVPGTTYTGDIMLTLVAD